MSSNALSVSNCSRKSKFSVFLPKVSRHTVAVRSSVGRAFHALSIGTKIDDLERPMCEIQSHLFLKCRQNGEIQLSNDSDAM